MADEKHRILGTLIFNDNESYEAYKNGTGTFNNGLRRDDGTLLCQPDFEEGYEEELSCDETAETTIKSSFNDSFSKDIYFLAGIVITIITLKVAPKIKNKWTKLVLPLFKRKKDKTRVSEEQEITRKKTTTKIVATEIIDNELPSITLQQIDNAYKEYNRNMTNEEAQRELLDIFILIALLKRKMKNLSDANIINEDLLIEKVTSKEYIECINKILIVNPVLCDNNTDTLKEILGRDIYKEGEYIPIDYEILKQQLYTIK